MSVRTTIESGVFNNNVEKTFFLLRYSLINGLTAPFCIYLNFPFAYWDSSSIFMEVLLSFNLWISFVSFCIFGTVCIINDGLFLLWIKLLSDGALVIFYILWCVIHIMILLRMLYWFLYSVLFIHILLCIYLLNLYSYEYINS